MEPKRDTGREDLQDPELGRLSEKDGSGRSFIAGLGTHAGRHPGHEQDPNDDDNDDDELEQLPPGAASLERRQSLVQSLRRSLSRIAGDEQTTTAPQQQRPLSLADMDPDFRVRFDGPGDPDDPHNLPSRTKAGLTLIMGFLAFAGSLGTSIITPAEPAIASDLGMSAEETVLLMALYVLGFALGPLLWAPASEAYGRRVSMLPALAVLGLFSIGSATSRSSSALLATRFLGGVFASAPISNVSAALGDIYDPRTRGVAMALYSLCVVGGPFLAPVAGAAIVTNRHMGWRWTLYIEAIVAFSAAATAALALPETYAPVLLDRKARRLRKEHGDARYWHPHEFERFTVRTIVSKHLARPVHMFFTEPLVACVALYASFVYGLIFLALEVYPIVFREKRGWRLVSSTLPNLALFAGATIAVGINIANQPLYARAVRKAGGNKAVPEARLPPIVLGCCLFTVGFFWFGWTAVPAARFPWPVPVVAGGLIGCGFNIVFQQCLNYLVDSYGRYAASATSANTILRSLLACGLPLAARPMFLNMGVGPAASVLGAISFLAVPVPILFLRYGPGLRARSKYVD